MEAKKRSAARAGANRTNAKRKETKRTVDASAVITFVTDMSVSVSTEEWEEAIENAETMSPWRDTPEGMAPASLCFDGKWIMEDDDRDDPNSDRTWSFGIGPTYLITPSKIVAYTNYVRTLVGTLATKLKPANVKYVQGEAVFSFAIDSDNMIRI